MKFPLINISLVASICMVIIGNSYYLYTMPAETTSVIVAETSIGDIVDKMLVLRIKQERIQDPTKLAHIYEELKLLQSVYETNVQQSNKINDLITQLSQTNKNLWNLEDAARLKEQQKCFDQEFINIVIAILDNNDRRAHIKRTINLITHSHIVEEKSYTGPIESSIEDCDKMSSKPPISLLIPIPFGDLADRITILLIKKEHINDTSQQEHIITEYRILNERLEKSLAHSDVFDTLFDALLKANQQLWDIQNRLRTKKQQGNFDKEFISLARSVYFVNDQRCAAKKQINVLCGSKLIEEKYYTPY
jgi:hypothetical protein